MTIRIPFVAPLVFVLLTGVVWADGYDHKAGGAEEALRTLDQAYVDAWLLSGSERQKEALLSLFASDAVIMPGGGTAPKRGIDELSAFWFPEGAPPTNVRKFEHVVRGVDVEDALGVVYGRSSLEFEYDGAQVAQEGNFLLTARQEDDGKWKIAHMIWNNRTLP